MRGILLAILAPLVWIYRRDAGELPWYLRIGLPLLRTLVLIGLLVVYLQPRWRSQREEHLDSRVLMLVDTSLSMARLTRHGRRQDRRSRGCNRWPPALDNTEFLARLRKKHHVTVVPFNSVLENDRRVVLPLEAGAGSRERRAGSREQAEQGAAEQGARGAGSRERGAGSKTSFSGLPAARVEQATRPRRHRNPPRRGPRTAPARGTEHAGFRGRADQRRRPQRRRVARCRGGTRPRVAYSHLHHRRGVGKEARRRPRGRLQCPLAGLSRRSLLRGRIDPGLRSEGTIGAR